LAPQEISGLFLLAQEFEEPILRNYESDHWHYSASIRVIILTLFLIFLFSVPQEISGLFLHVQEVECDQNDKVQMTYVLKT
jgi:hypothetical protein